MTRPARRRVGPRLVDPEDAGAPLPEGVRRQAERSFGRDFSGVRVHQDVPLDHLGAVAATWGGTIHLAPSAPPLASPAGRQLLVHELTHVTQQAGASPGEPRSVSRPADPAEREASAVAEGRVSPAADHGTAAPATIHLSGLAPVPVVPPGVPPGLIAQQILGEVTVGATSYGPGTALTFQSGATVTGATVTVASETTVTVGAATIGSEVAVVSGGSLAATPAATAGVAAAAAVGIVVVGALVVAGGILWIAHLASGQREADTRPGLEPGTHDLLPGGAPPPVVIAPPPAGHGRVEAPGATRDGPVIAPGAASRGPVTAPGTPGAGPVKAPGVVDDPEACLQLGRVKQPHWHHIFPREYVNEFEYLGIRIDDFTVKLPPDQHIGRRGVHLVLDWNAEWGEFFEQVPNDLDDARRAAWAHRAVDKALDLMGEMRQHLGRETLHRLVRYRTNKPSPVVKPGPGT